MLCAIPILAFLSSQQPDLTKKISLSSVARSADKIVALLAKEAGAPLLCSGPMSSEILVVRFQDVPVKEAMDRIARALCGKWSQDKGALVLFRDQERAAREESEALTRRAREIDKSIALTMARMKIDAFDEAGAAQLFEAMHRQTEQDKVALTATEEMVLQNRRLEEKAPAGRLLARLLPHLDSRRIAGIGGFGRIVFSTQPNRMQAPFVGDTGPIMALFRSEADLWLATTKKAIEGASAKGWTNLPRYPATDLGPGEPEVLVCLRANEGRAYDIELKVASASGKTVSQQHATLGIEESFMAPKAPKSSSENEAEIQLSEVSRAMVQAMSAAVRSVAGVGLLPPEIRTAVANAEANDPLSFIASEGLLALASGKDLNLVAALPDLSFGSLGLMPAIGKITPTTFEKHLDGAKEIAVTISDGWMEVMPVDGPASRVRRSDRRALGKFLTAGLKAGYWTLDQLAEYAQSDKSMGEFDLLRWFLALMVVPEAMGQMQDIYALQLYGSLSVSQRRSLEEGGRFDYGRLSKHQRSIVERMVYMGQSLRVRQPQNPTPEFYSRAYGMGQEPTEALPNGLPTDGYFTMKADKQVVAFASQGADSTRRPILPSDLAQDIFGRERPDVFPWIASRPPYSSFQVGDRLQVTFTFELTPELYMERQLNETHFNTASKPVAYNELPEQFRKEVEAELAKQRKVIYGNPARPGTAKPPPPR